jgi:hypothetical protein
MPGFILGLTSTKRSPAVGSPVSGRCARDSRFASHAGGVRDLSGHVAKENFGTILSGHGVLYVGQGRPQ